jgi:ribose transport system ATP-binding protein
VRPQSASRRQAGGSESLATAPGWTSGPDGQLGNQDALLLTGVTKSYPGVRALDNVDFSCQAGEIHALIGENGSGKSTLIKVASGAVVPDQGTVTIAGVPINRFSPLMSRRLGLLTAYQDTSLVHELSVADNLLLSFYGVRDVPTLRSRTDLAALLAPYDLNFSPDALVGNLSPAGRQLLEVVRALVHRPRVLLLDEPTAALDAESIARLGALLRTAKDSGMAIVYISHRLDEVERLADRITVLRDGVVQGSYAEGHWDQQTIINLMVGVPVDVEFPPRPEVASDAPMALETAGFSGNGFGPVSLHVRAGEIVGLAGAEGNGQRELIRSIVGLQRGHGGVRILGTPQSISSPRAARAAGMEFQSGDRASESIFGALSVMQNATISVTDELGPIKLVVRSRERKRFRTVAEQLRIAHASPDQPISNLSGGNQQKAVLARSILKPGRVVVLDEPTLGVDARARLDIYSAINKQARDGAAILLCSSDSAELAGLCNRVYAISRGRIVDELVGETISEVSIVDAFVRPAEGQGGDEDLSRRRTSRLKTASGMLGSSTTLAPSWGPLSFVAALIFAVGLYTAVRSGVFLTKSNISSLFIGVLPIAFLALGEQFCLLTGGFDISVGSTMSLSVVVASFIITSGSLAGVVLPVIAVIGIGIVVGVVNGIIIRVLNINALIGTIATLGMIQGIAIGLRPTETGVIGQGLTTLLQKQVGFMPIAFIVAVAIAVAADAWMMRTSSGLATRASGRAEEMTRRNGIRVNLVKFGGYMVCGGMAAIAGLFLAVQVGVGDSTAGADYALPAFAACFIGGASLIGGRVSFVGALLGATFLGLLTNVAPLINIPDATTQIITGALTIVAIIAYSIRSPWAGRALGRPEQVAKDPVTVS